MRRTGRSPFPGRTRLTLFIATVAAFLLVPAAQAFAGQAIVNISGSGAGEVTSVGEAIEGSPPIECSYEFPGPAEGTCETGLVEVEPGTSFLFVHAVPAPGSVVAEYVTEEGLAFGKTFAEPCNGTNTCHMVGFGGGNAKVTVVFEEEDKPEFPLTVTKSGSGEGTVTSTPAGIDCGSECEAEFDEGEEVELTASPESGSEFVEWTGACTGSGTCEVTMSEAQSVGAKFEPTPEFELEISTDGTGSGEVECEVDGGSAEPCEREYEEGTEFHLYTSDAADD